MTEPTTPAITRTHQQRCTGKGLLFTALLLLFAQIAHAAPRFMKVRVTFYSPSSRSKTATGRSARLPGVAVDPDIIPLGSRVAVPGFGVRVADDTGGAIKGNRIDVRLPSGNRAVARKHGVKHLRVRIVRPSKSRRPTRQHDADDTARTRRVRLAKAARVAKAKELRARREKVLRTKREKAEKRRLRQVRQEKLAQRKHALALRAAKRRKLEARAEREERREKSARAERRAARRK